MSDTSGLALDQAPPIAAPFRFFLTAPLFGLAAALLLLWLGPTALASRWMPGMLALVHLLTLGFMSMVMFGALLQMLPVVAGSPVPRPQALAATVHVLLVAGVAALAYGFAAIEPWALRVALALLGAAVAALAVAALVSLVRAPRRHPALNGMTLAVIALAVAATLGGWLLAGHGWSGVLLQRGWLTDLHAGWGLLGWVGMLVVGVAFQVVPMFQMTPEYPRWATRTLNPAILAALLAWSAVAWWPQLGAARPWILGVLALAFAAFAVLTLTLQRRRKRRLPDVTLSFWRVAMVCLLLTVAGWLATRLLPGAWHGDPRYELALGTLLLVGFGLSVINGMLYKIVPFLVWFHLQNRLVHSGLMAAGVRVPNMKQVLRTGEMKRQYRLHVAALVAFLPALVWPRWFVWPLGVLMALSFALLALNLWRAALLHRRENRRLDAALAERARTAPA